LPNQCIHNVFNTAFPKALPLKKNYSSGASKKTAPVASPKNCSDSVSKKLLPQRLLTRGELKPNTTAPAASPTLSQLKFYVKMGTRWAVTPQNTKRKQVFNNPRSKAEKKYLWYLFKIRRGKWVKLSR
jgi:hypothetical protein